MQGILIKYILLTLLLSTQLFSYDTNKSITLYGDVSEHLVHSSLTNKKENHYILNAYNFNNKGIKNQPLQLIFNDKTKFTIPKDYLSQRYRVKGLIFNRKYKDKKYVTEQIFKVNSIRKAREKMKPYSYLNNYGYVKLMVDSPMAGKEMARIKRINIDYITNLKVKADENLLYNVNLTPCVAENPLLKFSYKNIKPLFLTLEYTDNNVTIGTVGTKTIKVKHRNRIEPIPKQLKLLANPKSHPTQIESIKKLFGNITLIEDGIKLTAPKLAENGGSIPINIYSNIKFKSISLFVNSHYSSYDSYSNSQNYCTCAKLNQFNLVSQWFRTPYSIANFNIRIKMRQSGEVLVVLEAEDGKFYSVKQEIDVSIGGGN